MKKIYVSPKCELSRYELKTSILAGSTPQNSPGVRSFSEEKNTKTPTRAWGNLWQ
ncbi:MAG: hypothetical protein J6V20_07825 [Bacteroidaceae bacterium]|nr:hypothetical protein [Bacteroidaceae bacterium]